MPQILLVRHGQASWDGDEYDVLSPAGSAQSSLLGASLAALSPSTVVTGSMRRHRDTASIAVSTAGWSVVPTVDAGWDEFDHLDVLGRFPAPYDAKRTPARFQAWFESAQRRWTDGAHDDEYAEPFGTFRARVEDAVRRLADSVDGTAIVVTSGGPIAVVAATLLDPDRVVDLFFRLNPVLTNVSVTKLVVGRRGVTLSTYNEHAFLPPDQVTYR
jgi:broad specificity phosphatase PhoE